MDVVIAAAGKSSRFKTGYNSDHKALFEVEGKPLIGHILDRLRDSEEISRVVIVGANESADSQRIYEYVRGYAERLDTEVALVLGERKGYGFALYLGATALLEKNGTSKTVMIPCDTILKGYAPLLVPGDITLAVVPWHSESCKYSLISCDAEGGTDFSSDTTSNLQFTRRCAFLGVFSLSRRALEKFERLITEVVEEQRNSPNVWNNAHELRISWIWPELAREEQQIKAVDVEGFAELNFPTQIPHLESFIREQISKPR